MLAAVSIPVTAGALDELRTSMAARYLEGRIMNARATAVRQSTRIGLRFEAVGTDRRIGEYADGKGNGVRATDIAAGVDPEVAQAEFIGSLFPGVGFGLHSGVSDVAIERCRWSPDRVAFSPSDPTAPPRREPSTCGVFAEQNYYRAA